MCRLDGRDDTFCETEQLERFKRLCVSDRLVANQLLVVEEGVLRAR